jgi:hypothetical protein
VFSFFSVSSVLRFFRRKNQVKGFNTEDAEKTEGTENPEKSKNGIGESFSFLIKMGSAPMRP